MTNLSQADLDAEEAPLPEGVEVMDIPGLYTAARSGEKAGWRAIRGKTISATTATTIAGTNPFSSRMDLWRERVLGIQPVFNDFARRIMAYGTNAEPELVAEANRYVAEQALKGDSGLPFTLTHGYVVDHPTEPRWGCTPDAFRIVPHGDGNDEDLELAEFKTGSKPWAGKVPANYYDQVVWQMMVTGAARVLVVYRRLKRDRQGNVLEVVGHEFYWIEKDPDREAELVAAVEEWLAMEAAGTPPMVDVDLEDDFDDSEEESAEKHAARQALRALREADAKIAAVAAWEKKRKEALATLKAIAQKRQAHDEVTLQWEGYGAKLSRSTKVVVEYDVDRLTARQRDRIRTRTVTTTERLTAGPIKED